MNLLILVRCGLCRYRNSANTKQAVMAASIVVGRWKPASSIVLMPAEPRVMVVLASTLFLLAAPVVAWVVVSFVGPVVSRLGWYVKKGDVLFELEAGVGVNPVMLYVEILRYV